MTLDGCRAGGRHTALPIVTVFEREVSAQAVMPRDEPQTSWCLTTRELAQRERVTKVWCPFCRTIEEIKE